MLTVSFPLGDTVVAMAGVVGVLLACYHRDAKGGSGQFIDLSMYEPLLTLLGPSIAGWEQGTPSPQRSGSRVDGGVPRNVYKSSDGLWLDVSGTTDAQVARVLSVIGHTSPDDLARFGRSEERLKVGDELDGLVAAWIAGHDRATVLAAFSDARVPVAPVNDLGTLVENAQVLARGSLITMNDADLGTVLLPGPLVHLQGTPGVITTTGPDLGEHTAAVFKEWC